MIDPQLQPVNMHMHSHFSFNADGLSPAQLLEEAKRRGLYAAGILDFDVLDGLEETYEAAARLGIRAAVGLETRSHLTDSPDVEFNSPGEPGIYYQVAMGFGRIPEAESSAGKTLSKLRDLAQNRNREMIARINSAFPDIAIDYADEVLPLTPSGNPTERHLVLAYVRKVRSLAQGRPEEEQRIWSEVLNLPGEAVADLLGTEVPLFGQVRASLMKRGGAGYAQPEAANFPTNAEVLRMALDAGAIPLVTWLDGLSEGERDADAFMDAMCAKGAAGLSVIPDRNWNIADPDLRARKVSKLHEIVHAAEARKIPVNVGTELNNYGLPFVDDFQAEAMRPLWPAFFHGAQIMAGHARLTRYAQFSYCGPEATAEFGANLDAKNAFFVQAGHLPPLRPSEAAQLQEMAPEKALATIQDSVRAERWVF